MFLGSGTIQIWHFEGTCMSMTTPNVELFKLICQSAIDIQEPRLKCYRFSRFMKKT